MTPSLKKALKEKITIQVDALSCTISKVTRAFLPAKNQPRMADLLGNLPTTGVTISYERNLRMESINEILGEIIAVEPDWHNYGSLSQSVLKAIVKHCSSLTISHSLETGLGKSTLLFSHLSADHKVFSIDTGEGSISKVLESPLLNPKTVEFIEGPTQQTLPKCQFLPMLQAALIDGPHAYPFPDLEYYYIYPHLEAGAILIIDDIDIPSVRNMFRFLKADKMFSLIEVVEPTAFFRRTEVPTFDPLGDGWGLQGYNRSKLWTMTIAGRLSRILPSPLVNLIRKYRI